jgi:beta propeller repeat protein
VGSLQLQLRNREGDRLTDSPTLARGSAISGNRIVWGDIRGGPFSLYEYDFNRSDHERHANADSLENALTMWGSRVAWMSGNGRDLRL